jgi:hypothetical protein
MKHLQRSQMDLLFAAYEEARPGADPAEGGQVGCQGCRQRPDRACAACGALASIWTEAGDGRHAVAWCAACHELLLSGRPANAQPLAYLRESRVVATA